MEQMNRPKWPKRILKMKNSNNIKQGFKKIK